MERGERGDAVGQEEEVKKIEERMREVERGMERKERERKEEGI